MATSGEIVNKAVYDAAGPRTLDSYFVDWHSEAFGFGYGSGEPHTIPALKAFMAAIGRPDSARAYEYEVLEAAVTPTVAWLLINRLCDYDLSVIEYGTSPRYGWLTECGEKIRDYIATKTADELVDLVCTWEDQDYCSPTSCNCGPNGYEKGRICPNPFWHRRR